MTTPKKVTRQRPAASSEIAAPRLQAELEALTTGAAASTATVRRRNGTTARYWAKQQQTIKEPVRCCLAYWPNRPG